MKLNDLRNKIDSIDEEVIKLLMERFEVVKHVMSLKIEIEDKNRESEVLDKIKILTDGTSNPEFFEELYKMIFTESKNIQNKLSK